MDFVRKKKERILNVMETLGQGGGGGKLGAIIMAVQKRRG